MSGRQGDTDTEAYLAADQERRDAPHYFVTDARRTEWVGNGKGYQYDPVVLRRQRCQTCGGRPDDPVHDHARVRAYWSEA